MSSRIRAHGDESRGDDARPGNRRRREPRARAAVSRARAGRFPLRTGGARDRTDAEDVTQTTFLNAYLALRRGERPTTPGHWLIAIARNTCRERFRYGQRRPQEVTLVEEVSAAAVGDDAAPTAAELRGALLELPANQRAALVMRELEGRQCAEIARSLGISTSAVETLLFRARRSLREQLEEQLSCREAVVAISKQVKGGLARSDRPGLRAHLRRCPDCAQLARSLRARRTVLRGLLPLSWMSSLLTRSSTSGVSASGPSGVEAVGLAAKTGAILAAGVIAGSAVPSDVTHLARHATPRPSNSVPAGAMGKGTAHDLVRPTGMRAPRPAAGAAARRTANEPHRTVSAVPGIHPAQATTQAPDGLDSGGREALSGPAAPHVSPGNSHQPGSPQGVSHGHVVDSPGKKPTTEADVRSRHTGKRASVVSSRTMKGEVPRAQPMPKAQRPTSTSAATHANPAADPPTPAAAPGHGNGQGGGQANGQEFAPVEPPVGVPDQSNAGGNGHH